MGLIHGPLNNLETEKTSHNPGVPTGIGPSDQVMSWKWQPVPLINNIFGSSDSSKVATKLKHINSAHASGNFENNFYFSWSWRSDLFLTIRHAMPVRHVKVRCPSPKRYRPVGILANCFVNLRVHSHPDSESTFPPKTN